MHCWHSPNGDPTTITISHHQVITSAKLFDERRKRQEIVTPVRVAHDDVFSFRCFDPRGESGAVALNWYIHHSRIQVPRDFNGVAYVPIGGPIANTEIHILNENQQPCAIDEAGELYIAGAGVGRGYLNRPELTAQKFVVIDGSRLYRTGDWARLRADGRIEFAGRRDHQIKLRGFRVELGEIEAALSQHPGVRECAVIARNGNKNLDKRLLAYYVRRNGAIDTNDLRRFMNARLPDYSVPAAFVELKALPLSPNGIRLSNA